MKVNYIFFIILLVIFSNSSILLKAQSLIPGTIFFEKDSTVEFETINKLNSCHWLYGGKYWNQKGWGTKQNFLLSSSNIGSTALHDLNLDYPY